MSSESEYVNEVDSYESQIANYKNQALALWSGLENASELPRQVAGELGSGLAFEYGKGGVKAILNSKAAQAAKGRLVNTYENVKGALGRGFDKVVQQASDGVQEFADGLRTGVTDAASTVKAGLTDGLAQGAQGLSDGASTIRAGVEGLADNAASGLQSGLQSGSDALSSIANSGLQFADNGARMAEETGRSISSYGAESLAESKTAGGGLMSAFRAKLLGPRVTGQGRIGTALGADEFEDGAYSLIDQPGAALRSRTFVGLVSDGYGNKLGTTMADVAGEGPTSVVSRSVEGLQSTLEDGLNEAKGVSQTLSDLVNANKVADTIEANASAIQDLTGATMATADAALETGATAIKGGTELLGGAADAAGATAAATGEAIGSTVAETTGEVLDALGPETFGLSDIAGLALGLGGVLYSVFGGHEEPPTVDLPNYSQPVEALGLGRG